MNGTALDRAIVLQEPGKQVHEYSAGQQPDRGNG